MKLARKPTGTATAISPRKSASVLGSDADPSGRYGVASKRGAGGGSGAGTSVGSGAGSGAGWGVRASSDMAGAPGFWVGVGDRPLAVATIAPGAAPGKWPARPPQRITLRLNATMNRPHSSVPNSDSTSSGTFIQ